MATLTDQSGVVVFEGTITGVASSRIAGANDPGGATGGIASAGNASTLLGGAMTVRAGISTAGQVGGQTTLAGGDGDAGASPAATLTLGGGQTAGGTRGDATFLANVVTISAAQIGFYNSPGVAQQTGVAVNAAAIHAALVNLGLITA